MPQVTYEWLLGIQVKLLILRIKAGEREVHEEHGPIIQAVVVRAWAGQLCVCV